MKITSIRVRNYKSFADTGTVELAPGFNLIVGKNDSGKSALVEAMGIAVPNKPHRSVVTVPQAGGSTPNEPLISVTYEFASVDMQQWAMRQSRISVPYRHSFQNSLSFFNDFIRLPRRIRAEFIGANLQSVHSEFDDIPDATLSQLFINNQPPNRLELTDGGAQQKDLRDYMPFPLVGASFQLPYIFRAERLNVGECGIAGNNVLQPNASNLADTLNQLSSTNPARYARLLAHIKTIFPHITNVSAAVIGGGVIKISIWTVPIETERADLAVPLQDSGTGIGQVLAMLYVVMTSEAPRVIIIDEPQSFIHPGALRKLLEILRGYSQHQYVMTSHSPISLERGDRLLLVRRDPETQSSNVVLLDSTRNDDVRTVLADVGMRLSDVFGADSIFWVEGKTEETCFPELLHALTSAKLEGVQILGVVSTDELARKKTATRIFEIYAKVSGQASLLPPALAYMFDRDGRSPEQCREAEHLSGNRMRWLPLAMYENYLLVPEALVQVLNSIDRMANAELVTVEAVRAWLTDHGGEPKYFWPRDRPVAAFAEEWLARVRGGLLLQDMFAALTDAQVEYDKVKHGLALTRYLIDHPPPDIQDLADLLKEIVEAERPA